MSDAELKAPARRAPHRGSPGTLAVLGALALAWLASSPSRAAPQGRLNVAVAVQGVGRITDLLAQPGSSGGSIQLSWTEPGRNLTVGPHAYQVRVSTLGQIDNEADFASAKDLSVFSPALPPAPGPGGGGVAFLVTGLNPFTTYYFAAREVDSDSPQHIGIWLRNVPQGWNVNNSSLPAFLPGPPDPVTDLTAQAGTLEGEVDLTWTAPANPNGVPMASYELRMATFSVADLGGDTTAWFNLAAASSVAVSPALAPGTTVSLTVGALFPASTWYFGVKSADLTGQVSPIDLGASGGSQAQALPRNFAPATPSGLAGSPGFARADLSWTGLPDAGKGLDFAHYALYRSTDPGSGFAAVATTTAVAFTDFPLTPFTSYYYRVSARDHGGLESALSAPPVLVVPFALPPMEPIGVGVVPSSSSVALSWSPVARFSDGTPFVSAVSPTAEELQGYSIRRSTALCSPAPVWIASTTVSVTTFTDATAGLPYFYEIRAFNTTGLSTATLVLSSLGDQHFFLDDCSSRIQLTMEQTEALRGATNGLGADVRLARSRRPQETDAQRGILQSAAWLPLLDGVTPLPEFRLASPARVFLHFLVSGGLPVPQATPAAPAVPQTGAAASGPLGNLGMFWHNGAEFKKMYGKVDPFSQTVTVETPNLGLFQVRTQLRQDGAVFDLSNLSSRVITPNGDGLNDLFIVTYDPGPRGAVAEGEIFDLRGARVASMRPGLVPNTIVWDGRMNGAPVASGVYVYQIKGDGKTFNGTIVVAR